jgi:hypothetical protein
MLPCFLDKFHEGNDVTEGHRHGYVLHFGREECDLGLQLRGPNDGTGCIKYYPFTPRCHVTRASCCNLLVPIACDVSIAIALEAFGKVWLEANANVTRGLEIFDYINNCLSML